MLFEAVVLPIILGFIRGGSIRNLEKITIKGLPLLFLPLLIRFVTYNYSQGGVDFFINYGGYLQSLAFIILIGFFIMNRHIRELKLVFIGVLLNSLVIFLNGGAMPVSEQALQFTDVTETPVGTHTFITQETVLPFLGDIIPIPSPYPFSKVISIGDIIIVIGIFLLIYRNMFPGKSFSRAPSTLDID
ncbi:DUF5317 domain-containing protein [Natranaerobius thermophilus]|uniref:DUF5317 domain-containing protein n=1 Tax=Natranaerobius thermophilus (strain ATCC BAA-1301 / DSM 18059 / JW/NM-WN-LF) TaxID=457570 RepID=B2A734_NATTJ|nr:DUF5317 domain-containing protein [Natranaerobius thermophilus]ACB85625.1 conserved hypothetical protein [Natranaerobius thermophilus JW/NM-WN-LF]